MSADGSHILFTRSDAPMMTCESLRCGRQTLWLACLDGANPIQVTGELYIDSDLGGPDTRRAAFDWLRCERLVIAAPDQVASTAQILLSTMS